MEKVSGTPALKNQAINQPERASFELHRMPDFFADHFRETLI
jgi:hypothetical protein